MVKPMANNKRITVDQLDTALTGMAEKNDLRFMNKNDKITKSNLSTTLATELEGKVDSSDVYTKTAADAKIDEKIAAALGSVYTPGGSKTMSQLTSTLLVAANQGKVYNVSDGGTSTADFVEGAGKPVPAGANVAVINTGTDESPVYKFDAMPGFVDLSGLATAEDVEVASSSDIQAIVDGLYQSA